MARDDIGAAMWMKHIGVCLLLSIATQSVCCGNVTKLSAEDRKILQESPRFHEIRSAGDLPPAIVALCGSKIADPGQKWNATDSIIDPTLPGKRLVWAVVDGDYYVVHYERGGIAHTYHILVAKMAKDQAQAKEVWSALGGPFINYAVFLDALRNGKLDDRMDYGH